MEKLLARQPIFDEQLNVFAYELLYRSNKSLAEIDGTAMTSNVISQSLLGSDINKIVADKKVFINFTEQIILDEIALMLDKERLVVEVLENVTPSADVLRALKRIKLLGYCIALDDITAKLPAHELIELADIAKVDFLLTNQAERAEIVSALQKYQILLLAEKIEDMSEFREAVSMGFNMFQGYFFAKPDVLKTNELKPLKINQVRLIGELFSDDPSYDKMTDIVESDVTLSFKLLKIINSVAFYRHTKINSIHQALVIFGIKELRKWLAFIMMQDVSDDKPDELFKLALIRARMIESLCRESEHCDLVNEGFLVGIMSLIDVMTDRDMANVLAELPLDQSIIDALLTRQSLIGQYLTLLEFYENSQIEAVKSYAEEIGVDLEKLPSLYFEALEWTEELVARD